MAEMPLAATLWIICSRSNKGWMLFVWSSVSLSMLYGVKWKSASCSKVIKAPSLCISCALNIAIFRYRCKSNQFVTHSQMSPLTNDSPARPSWYMTWAQFSKTSSLMSSLTMFGGDESDDSFFSTVIGLLRYRAISWISGLRAHLVIMTGRIGSTNSIRKHERRKKTWHVTVPFSERIARADVA